MTLRTDRPLIRNLTRERDCLREQLGWCKQTGIKLARKHAKAKARAERYERALREIAEHAPFCSECSGSGIASEALQEGE